MPHSRSEDFEFFEKKIRPILVDRCYECHSASSKKLKGDLYLDNKSGVLKGGASGPALVPGKPEDSLLFRAIEHKDPDTAMPPKAKLAQSEIDDFRRWIASGAPDPRTGEAPKVGLDAKTKWAFTQPVKPAVPTVKDASQVRTEIDSFIQAKLEEANLAPSKQANKRALIRRATYDLSGLPPTYEEIQAFVADERANAFELVVERLLASPQYGERWGRHWLDVVRYTDAIDARGIGGEADVPEAYRYRDWVVQSFNKDLPFKDFVQQQIAGDLLTTAQGEFDPNPLIATSVMAIGEWGIGDADKEKMVTDIVDDQVDVVGRAFLGLTIACARCHDHKFDPISTADYYGLAGMFFSSHIIPKPGPKTAGSPVMRIPLLSEGEIAKRKAYDDRMKFLAAEQNRLRDTELARVGQSEGARLADYLTAVATHPEWRKTGAVLNQEARRENLDPLMVTASIEFFRLGDLPLMKQLQKEVLGKKGLFGWSSAGKDTPSAVINTTSAQLEFLTIKMPPKSVAIHPAPTSGVAAHWIAPTTARYYAKVALKDADGVCGNGVAWELNVRQPGQSSKLLHGKFTNGGEASGETENAVALKVGEILELVVLPGDNDHSCDSTVINFEVIEEGEGGKRWDLTADVVKNLAGDPTNPAGDAHGNTQVWALSDLSRQGANGSNPAVAELAKLVLESKNAEEIKSAADKFLISTNGEAKLTFQEEIKGTASSFWSAVRDRRELFPAAIQATLKGLADEEKEMRSKPFPAPLLTHGMQEGGTPESPYDKITDARIHIRGRYDRLGPIAPRQFPEMLAGKDQTPIKEGSGRRELGHWLSTNGLVARVMVNRVWQHHFGEGLVRTPNNFGKLGEAPTHPELLDYLTTRFMAEGGSVKSLHRLIMRSATYQRSTEAGEELRTRDPENLLWGRMARSRVDAEMLRDAMLIAAGKLDLTMGGPATRDLNAPRRTMYLMTIRSERSDYRTLFDAADPTGIVEKRTVTTVAPQALFLMNHPFVQAQAENLANRVKAKPQAEHISESYKLSLGRLPSPPEASLAGGILESNGEDGLKALCQILIMSNEFAYLD